jgi:predicted nuclease of predicted toxin-antitoxin system
VALKFYFDTHIAKAAAVQLRAKDVEVIRCEEIGMAEASDEAHLALATQENAIIVSQDADFTGIDLEWKQKERQHAGIMRVPQHLQGEAQISFIVRKLLFYAEAEDNGAIDYPTEIFDTLIYL